MEKYININVLKQQDFQDFSQTDVFYAIDHCPTVELKPVIHAYWKIGYFHDRVCSYCLHPSNDLDEKAFLYCPHCGAIMNKK